MESPLFHKLLIQRVLTFKCQFLGTQDVMSDVMCAEALKKYSARTRRFLAGYWKTHCEICIGRTHVWIEEEKTPGKHFHPISRLSFITQDPDDKTVFGYVFTQPNNAEYIYKLYAFKSEEPEVIIKTLREYLGDATNVTTEAPASSYDRKNDKMTGDNFYGLEVGSMVEVPLSYGIQIFGVIRWMGNMPQRKGKLVAGLEMEKEESYYSDGTCNGERYFTCPAGKGFFTLLSNCQPDSRLESQTELQGMRARLSNLQQQLREKDDQLLEKANLLKERNRLNVNLRAINQQLKNARGQLQDQELLKTNMQEQLEGKEQQLVEMELRLREMNQQLRDLQVQITEKDRATVALQERLGISVQQVGELEEQLTRKDQEKNELAKSLSTAQKTLRDNQVQRSPDWVIARNQIQLTGKTLGRGAWGEVAQGRFCGCVVAVKTIYDVILSPHNLRLFMREMDIASRCRHPCLLQFIGATNDDHTPLFLTELMETSLRALLEERSLSQTEITVIALDVARGLNYLHQKHPIPILHRDISSANVLLWRQGTQWRAKVSDYGTANFKKQTMTVAPGAPIYSAPEAHATNQTVKVDVYSFGVLLCEMSIRELPDPEIREQQVAMVTNSVLRALIRRCLETDPQARPSMEELIDEIELETQGTV